MLEGFFGGLGSMKRSFLGTPEMPGASLAEFTADTEESRHRDGIVSGAGSRRDRVAC